MKRSFSILGIALISLSAHAGLSKWVDAEGKVHYSDTVPPEVTQSQTVRNISGKSQGDTPTGYSPKSLAEREADLKKSKQAKAAAAEKQSQQDAQAEAKSRNCDAARQNAKAIEDGMRIVSYDTNGERIIMDDETRAKKLEEARQTISANCN